MALLRSLAFSSGVLLINIAANGALQRRDLLFCGPYWSGASRSGGGFHRNFCRLRGADDERDSSTALFVSAIVVQPGAKNSQAVRAWSRLFRRYQLQSGFTAIGRDVFQSGADSRRQAVKGQKDLIGESRP